MINSSNEIFTTVVKKRSEKKKGKGKEKKGKRKSINGKQTVLIQG